MKIVICAQTTKKSEREDSKGSRALRTSQIVSVQIIDKRLVSLREALLDTSRYGADATHMNQS